MAAIMLELQRNKTSAAPSNEGRSEYKPRECQLTHPFTLNVNVVTLFGEQH